MRNILKTTKTAKVYFPFKSELYQGDPAKVLLLSYAAF